MKIFFRLALLLFIVSSCKDKLTPVADDALTPDIITEEVLYDTDDPAIWINPDNSAKSYILGTDKENGGGLYMYDFEGKIVNKYINMQRPNNVDIAYGFPFQGDMIDIALVTERNTSKLRIFRLPELTPVDEGGIPVFEGEKSEDFKAPMGVAVYADKQRNLHRFYAVIGRKDGPVEKYLWQYELKEKDGKIQAEVVRKFGNYSGKKEIEAIAVDSEMGYIYYSDETAGIRKYYADPSKGDQELAFFGRKDAKRDHEGLSIYKTGKTTGYIIVSDQQANSILIYPREGTETDPHNHQLIVRIPISAIECDGLEAISTPINKQFDKGVLVTMSNGKVFHIYDWKKIQTLIDKALAE